LERIDAAGESLAAVLGVDITQPRVQKPRVPGLRTITVAMRLPPFLRANDRRTLGGIVAVGLAALALWWVASGGLAGRWIDAERLPRRENRFQVDVNQASEAELAAIPEVGPSLAGRIVEYRRRAGGIRSHEQLLEVRGIGPKTLAAMRPFLLPIDEPAVR
jgi:competence ComEA-like helix-hairpin-helix protein